MLHFSLNDTSAGASVLPGIDFRTPWQGLDLLELDSGARAGGADAREEGWILLEGAVELVAADGTVVDQSAAPAALTSGCGLGLRHSVRYSGNTPARLLYAPVKVAPQTNKPQGRVAAITAESLKWRDAIHGGIGCIATRHIWNPDDFCSTWTYIDHAVLAADSSVGYHYHDALEECFIVLAGDGLMTIDGNTFAVGPGSVTWQGIGQDHGIYNPGPDPLDFLRLAVALPGETVTTIDRHDDLQTRRP
jgi:mannose-6-phosphate isomerase-like protein (cupin superfamily)